MCKKLLYFILTVFSLFIMTYSVTLSNYCLQENGSIKFSVAKPICKAIITGNLHILKHEQKPLYFSVRNFDEQGNTSEVAMQYYITLKITQSNAPLKYKLYKINGDGIEKELKMNVSTGTVRTTSATTMSCYSKETHNYRLEIEYDNNSNVALDEDIGISVILDSEQIILKQRGEKI